MHKYQFAVAYKNRKQIHMLVKTLYTHKKQTYSILWTKKQLMFLFLFLVLFSGKLWWQKTLVNLASCSRIHQSLALQKFTGSIANNACDCNILHMIKKSTGILKYCKPVKSSCSSSFLSLPVPNGFTEQEVTISM